MIFFGRYDENGKRVLQRPKYLSENTKYPFNVTKSSAKMFDSSFSMKFMADNVKDMQTAIVRSKAAQKGSEFSLGLGKMIFQP